MVPCHWAAIAGAAIQTTAQLGTAVVSKSRTDMYMKEVNEKMFKSRGLKVGIASAEAMRAILHVPGTQPVLAPLANETVKMNTVERELLAMRPYNAVLELDVSKPAEQTTMLAKLSARQVEVQIKKHHQKALEGREKALKKEGKRERKNEKRAEKRDRKGERKHGKKDENSESDTGDGAAGSGRDQAEYSRQRERRGKKGEEEKNAEKALWIVVENLNPEIDS